MIKWLKRLVVYPFLAIMLLIIAYLVFVNPQPYYLAKSGIGSLIQWFGNEEKGNNYIESSIPKLNQIRGETYHAWSVQNTKNGNYDEAIRYLENAAQLDPLNADGYYGWVLLYYYRDYDKALFHLNRLDSATTFVDYVGDDNILFAKGMCYKQKGNYTKALDLFEQSIAHELEVHSESWITHQMYFQTGRALQLLDRKEEAIEYYNKAIANWNGSSESIYYKGLAEIDLGINTGCDNLKKALAKVKQGIKSSHSYVRLFDEIYVDQVEAKIGETCGG